MRTLDLPTSQPRRWIRRRLNRWQAARYHRNLSNRQEDADLCADFLIEEYGRQVADPSMGRHELSALLAGIAGCYFTQTATLNARGYGIEADQVRLTGLLALELSFCAGDDAWRGAPEYRGVRSVEFMTEEIADALMWVALAYRQWSYNPWGNLREPLPGPTVAERLRELDAALEDATWQEQPLLTEESGLLLSRLTWAHEAVAS